MQRIIRHSAATNTICDSFLHYVRHDPHCYERENRRCGTVRADSITMDERDCRDSWSCPKTTASGAAIGVEQSAIQRIQRLRGMEVKINCGARQLKAAKAKSAAIN